MREIRTSGSVRGAGRKARPYRACSCSCLSVFCYRQYQEHIPLSSLKHADSCPLGQLVSRGEIPAIAHNLSSQRSSPASGEPVSTAASRGAASLVAASMTDASRTWASAKAASLGCAALASTGRAPLSTGVPASRIAASAKLASSTAVMLASTVASGLRPTDMGSMHPTHAASMSRSGAAESRRRARAFMVLRTLSERAPRAGSLALLGETLRPKGAFAHRADSARAPRCLGVLHPDFRWQTAPRVVGPRAEPAEVDVRAGLVGPLRAASALRSRSKRAVVGSLRQAWPRRGRCASRPFVSLDLAARGVRLRRRLAWSGQLDSAWWASQQVFVLQAVVGPPRWPPAWRAPRSWAIAVGERPPARTRWQVPWSASTRPRRSTARPARPAQLPRQRASPGRAAAGRAPLFPEPPTRARRGPQQGACSTAQ
ncbi:MAG: hypothetical protein RLZZ450_4996 [Pseudomonadota bacterium]